jgi:hypothetical protein
MKKKPEGVPKFIEYQAPASTTRGPFAIGVGVSVPTPIDSFPFRDVAGGTLIVNVSEAAIGIGITPTLTALIAEIEIVGKVQGIATVLKRTQIRLQTGPTIYRFYPWELYDTIEIRARNMTGGRPGGQAISPGSMLITLALQPNVELMKR